MVSTAVKISLTRVLEAVPFQSTTPSMCGATVATRNERAESVFASPATASGRRTAKMKIRIDVHFQFHLMGVRNERVPPALLSGV